MCFWPSEGWSYRSLALGVGTPCICRKAPLAKSLTFSFVGAFDWDLSLESTANWIVMTRVSRPLSNSWSHDHEYGGAGSGGSTRDMDGSLQCRKSKQENTDW